MKHSQLHTSERYSERYGEKPLTKKEIEDAERQIRLNRAVLIKTIDFNRRLFAYAVIIRNRWVFVYYRGKFGKGVKTVVERKVGYYEKLEAAELQKVEDIDAQMDALKKRKELILERLAEAERLEKVKRFAQEVHEHTGLDVLDLIGVSKRV